METHGGGNRPRNGDCPGDSDRLKDGELQGMVTIPHLLTVPEMVIILDIVTVLGMMTILDMTTILRKVNNLGMI